MFEKFTEANCSTDIECEVVRIFDLDPTKRWPPRQIYLTVGGYPIERMPYVEEEKKRPRFLRDEIMQITWYVVYGSIHEQKNVIIYEMLPHVMSVMKEDYGEILWIPCPMDYEEADYKRDYKEVLDCVEKVAEYNARYGTHFKIGFGKMWMPMGVEFEKERVYLANLNACLDVMGFYYQECRVLDLGIYTTTTDEKYEYPVGIKERDNQRFKHTEYFETWGFKLTDYCLRTMRQRIKKLLGEEGVEPISWKELVREGVVRQPGYYTSEGRVTFTPPQEETVKPVILQRAKIRAEFSISRDKEKILALPALPGLKFDKIRFSTANISADQVCQNMRIYRGNGIRTNLLSLNSDFIPARALLRYAQERGKEAGTRVRIPPTESMTGLEITVSNRKPENLTPKPSLSKRLGSPRGEKEKGEVTREVRREDREVEVIAELKVASASAHPRPVEKARAAERFELDSSFEKPVKKRNKKKVESSTSSDSSSSSSEDDDGEPVTKDLVRMQAMKVELEVSKLMKLKEKYKKQRKLLKKQKK